MSNKNLDETPELIEKMVNVNVIGVMLVSFTKLKMKTRL